MLLMLKFILPLAFMAMPTFTPTAQAESSDWDYFQNVTVMSLNAEARITVEQDRLKATLRIEHEAKTPEAVQAFINGKMKKAISAAKTVKSVKATTGRYSVNKRAPYDRKLTQEQRDHKTTWVGQQTIVLDGGNKADILKLAGGIQSAGFAMNGLNYYLSREKSDQYKEQLTKEAIANVQMHAKSISKQLGSPKIHFARINFNNTMPRPMRVAPERMMMMAKSMSADAMPEPTAEAGESDIVVTANVEVHLSK